MNLININSNIDFTLFAFHCTCHMNDFSTLFPHNVSSKELLESHALNGLLSHISCYSAIWKQFLIIFPNNSNKILESHIWIKTLQEQRAIFSEKLSKAQQNPENKEEIILNFGHSFHQVSGSLNSVILNSIISVLSLFIKKNSTKDFINSICSITTWIYYYFELESIKNDGTPMGILLDKEYIFVDLAICLDKFLVTFSYLFHARPQDIYGQILFMVNKVNPISKKPSLESIPTILQLYKKLFTQVTKRNEVAGVISIIFSQYPDISILHYFYSCIFLYSGKDMPDENAKVPMISIGCQYGRTVTVGRSVSPELVMAGQLDELIKLIKDCDSKHNREVVKNQLEAMIQIVDGNIFVADLLPVSVVDRVIQDE